MAVMAALKTPRLAQMLVLLACGIAIGFTLRTILCGNDPVSGAVVASSPEERPPGSDDLRMETKGAAAGTCEEQFAAALKHGNEGDQRQAARAVFADLGLDELTPLQARVEKFSEEFSEKNEGNGGWILCHEFYRRWGMLAPLEALESLKHHESYWAGMIASVWTAWALADPDAAVAAYDPGLESQYSSELMDAVLKGLCLADPVKALRFADAQKTGNDFIFNPENRDEIYSRHSNTWELLEYVPVERPYNPFGLALYSWFHRDPEGALEAILTLHYDTLQRASLNALFANWFMHDPDAALLSLNKIDDRGLRESTTHTALQAYLLRHPRKAFELIIHISEYQSSEYQGDPFAEADPVVEEDSSGKTGSIDRDEEQDGISLPYRYCDTTPTRTYGRMDLVSEAAASLGISEGKAAWDRAAAIEDKNKRAAALGGALAGWLISDLEGAAGFTAEGIHNRLFEAPGGPRFPDFAARLVGKNLAQHDFQRAAAWIGDLPAGPLREAGIVSAAHARLDQAWQLALKEASPEGWVDPQVFQHVQIREYAPVMGWLASLPASKGRDEATGWLVFRLRDHDDPRSALKWAATIADPRMRRLSFESIARGIFPKKDNESVDFDFDAWAAAHPELAAELKLELSRKMNRESDGGDE